jgi:hypothetical protein
MASDIDEQVVSHEIDAYLCPIHLPGKAEGKYLAKTKSGPASHTITRNQSSWCIELSLVKERLL